MNYKMKNIIKLSILLELTAQIFVCSVAHTQEKFHEYLLDLKIGGNIENFMVIMPKKS